MFATLLEARQRAPEAFLAYVLPFVLDVIAATARRSGDPPWRDSVWGRRYSGEFHELDGALLAGIVSSLCTLAERDAENFANLAAGLRGLPFETIEYILIRAYAANGPRFADEAAEYLCESPDRLGVGYWNGEQWASRELLEAITPHCSSEHLARLERMILRYVPARERGRQRRLFGSVQWILLQGITPERRSAAATRLLAELSRKFGETAQAPQIIEVQDVVAPLPDHAIERMTDEQWLGAIATYGDDGELRERDGELVGGARQLPMLLTTRVRREPARFAELACRLADEAHSAYFEAILSGLNETELDIELLLRVWRRCHALPGRPCGTALCDSIAAFAERPLPDEALDIVAWYASNDPDPREESWRLQLRDEGNDRPFDQTIRSQGLNSVRGRAALALGRLIWHDGTRLTLLLPALERSVHDPSLAVRSCTARSLIAVLKHDPGTAVSRFCELCETDDALLATNDVEEFLRRALPGNYGALAAVLGRVVDSDEPEVQAVGGRQASLVALTLEEARPLGERARGGSIAHRLGSAQVFAANIRQAACRAICEEGLMQLFDDPDGDVRAAAAGCFRGFAGDKLGGYADLVGAFIESRAFDAHHPGLLRALEKTTARLPDETCRACERFVEVVGTDAGDIRSRAAADSRTVSTLLIRIYGQTRDPAVQRRCLDLIDGMLAVGAYDMGEILHAYER